MGAAHSVSRIEAWYLPMASRSVTCVELERGSLVDVQDAFGQWLRRRALGPAVPGHDFQVVWVVREEEWDAARTEAREPDGVPWPAEDVRLAQSAAVG